MLTTASPLYGLSDFGPPGPAQTQWVDGAGGLRLRTALFPATQPRGSVVLNTGRTEFIEKYYEVVGELLARGFTVLVHDWRGQGESDRLLPDRLKGHAQGAAAFLDDLDTILACFKQSLPRPWIVMGHSMGGAITLLHLLERSSPFQAAVLSSPMIGVNLHGRSLFARLSITARRLIGRLGDYVETPTSPPWEDQFPGNSVSHDEDRFMRTLRLLEAHHDLALGGPTWGWLDFALTAAETIQSHPGASGLAIPVHVVAAGQESLADTPATQAFCKRLSRGDCVVAPDAKHEILMEQDPSRAIFWNAFDTVANSLA